jgi:hypothetical protein
MISSYYSPLIIQIITWVYLYALFLLALKNLGVVSLAKKAKEKNQ